MKFSLLSLAITSIIFSSANVIASEVEQTSPNSINKAENAIETIEVTGRAFSLYRPTESAFGTRTNTPLEKIPQSIQILPQALISDQAARQITDLYSNIAGVNGFSYSGDRKSVV